jgi:hypothetical protein
VVAPGRPVRRNDYRIRVPLNWRDGPSAATLVVGFGCLPALASLNLRGEPEPGSGADPAHPVVFSEPGARVPARRSFRSRLQKPSNGTHMLRVGLILASAFCTITVAGCSTLHPAHFNEGAGLGLGPALIVPFAEPKNHRHYNESPRGRSVAEALKSWAMQNWSAEFPDVSDVRSLIKEISDRERIPASEWPELVKRHGVEVDYVVFGEILDFRLRNPRRIGIKSASLKASYRVVNCRTGKIAFYKKNRTIEYGNYANLQGPESVHVDLGTMESGQTSLERLLLARAGTDIGKELYGYREPR